MAIKQDFTKHLESQIAVWQAQIAEHQERLKQAGAQAKADYDKGVTEVQARAEEAAAKAKADYEAAIKQLQASAEEAGKLLGKVREFERACVDRHAECLRQGVRAAAEGLGRRAEAVRLSWAHSMTGLADNGLELLVALVCKR